MSTPSGMERDPRSGPQEWTCPTEPRATTGHNHAGHEPDTRPGGHGEHGQHGGHGLMMIVCCIPMLLIGDPHLLDKPFLNHPGKPVERFAGLGGQQAGRIQPAENVERRRVGSQ